MKFLDLLRQPGLRLLDGLPCAVAAQDDGGRIVYVNPALCRELGVSAEEVVGRSGAAQLPEAERSRYVDAMCAWRQGIAQPLRTTIRLAERSDRPLLILPQPLADASGRITGTLLLIVDPEPLADAAGDRMRSAGQLARSLIRTISDELGQALGRSDEVHHVELEDLRRRVSSLKKLTRREWAVASRIGRGDRTLLVAKDLGISANTVRNHLKSIFRKTGVRSQVELVASFKQWRDRLPPTWPVVSA